MKRILLISLSALCFSLSTGCAAVREYIVDKAKEEGPKLLDVAIEKGDKIAKQRFDEKYKPVTGYGYEDYDKDNSGSLDIFELAYAVKDYSDHAPKSEGEGDSSFPIDPRDHGAEISVALASLAYWLRKRGAKKEAEELAKKVVNGSDSASPEVVAAALKAEV